METPPELLIRRLLPGDAEALTALHALPGVRFGTLRLPYPSVEAVRRRLEAAGENDIMLAALVGAQLVGTAGLHRKSGRQGHVAVLGIGIHDDWTGQGIGRRLLVELIDIADNWLGLKRLELEVYTDNAAAIALYRSLGFAIEGRGRATALRDGVLVDDYRMARLLVS